MLTKKIHILWFNLEREDRHLHLSFPIPFYIFVELLDCILDLLEFTCLLIPERRQKESPSFSVHGARTLAQYTINLFDSLAGDEPYYLFDVKADKIKLSAKIK